MRYKMRVRETVVLRAVARALIPFILIFALYVQFHGDFGPGGGFQAGVIFAAGLILYSLIFGLDALERVASPRTQEVVAALGVLLYGGVGVASLLRHGNFLDYGVLSAHDPVHGQHLGILLVELGVGIAVAAVMIIIFRQFAGRGRD
jgi:multicomponent Na+:H+ antiporter subunit B